MAKRTIGPFQVEAVGLGCMGLSHAYGSPPSREDAARLLAHAIDLGIEFLDTAALYGFGHNEELIGEALGRYRERYVLASKCGMTGVDNKRVIDGRPATLSRTIDASLRRLRTDRIDLYYLHRLDRAVPIEDSIGALARMVEAGKVRAIGLSEVSAATLEKAQAIHPIAAVQSEYSPWSREADIAILEKTAEIGAAFVAFSPLARGFLAGAVTDPSLLGEGDIRRGMPRFWRENLRHNLKLLPKFRTLADQAGVSSAQLAIAWGLAKAPHLISIPGTTSIQHLQTNFDARNLTLSPRIVSSIDELLNRGTVSGERYPEETFLEIDTERFRDRPLLERERKP